MKSALAGTLERARSTFSTISLGQKVVIGLLLVGLLLGGFFFFRWITAPTQAPLFSNLASSDASAIVDELNASGTAYTLADGGQTIMVAQDQVYNLRLSMSGKGLPAAGKGTGYALLDQQGITTSEFQQQTTYQRALEGELSNTLEALKGVNTAVVHIALPKDQVFVTDQKKPTASVLLALAPGTTLTGEQVQAVTNLVSSSIVGMDAGQVTVTDSTGHVLAAPGTGITAGAGDARSQAEQAYEARLAANAQQILDTVVGPGHSKVSVRADVDLNKKQSTSETYTYTNGTPPLSSSTSSEKYTGNGTPVGGVLGPSNMPNAATGGGTSTYDKSSTTDNNAVDKTTTTIDAAPGALNRLTVSVVMDNAVAGSLNQNQIQSLIGNSVGLDTARGDAITVASMPFDTTASKQAAADLTAAKAAEASAQMWSMIKTGGIAAGIALVVLLVWLRSRRREEIEEEYEPLELSDDMLAELDRLRVASSREELPKVDNRQMELEAAERQKVRGDISTMVSERPDEVAAMLRGWLSENKA
jgi:flagellar M-ring protein FliF